MTTEGSVYRRKDGRWVAQYRDARDKVRYVYRKTRGETKKALREALQDRDEGYVPADKLTVGLYVEGWMEDRRDTVKREIREEQEKNKDTLLYAPMDEMRRKQMLIQRLEG